MAAVRNGNAPGRNFELRISRLQLDFKCFTGLLRIKVVSPARSWTSHIRVFEDSFFFFEIGCVYIDTCLTNLPGKVNSYNFKNLPIGSTICFLKNLENAYKKSSILEANF